MKKTRIAINGFGRIGRAFLKIAKNRKGVEIIAINDLGNLENFAYLLKYDTVYGKSGFEITTEKTANESFLIVDGKKIKYLSEKEPNNLPWKNLDIDVVVESSGFFTSYEKSKAHLDAGAKRVVISAPVKDDAVQIIGETVLLGINEDKLKTCVISSNASCTTNAGSPLIAILNEKIGIEKAILNTVHGYTASQSLVDSPSKKDLREGRAAAMNIVPSSTGAAIAMTKAFPLLEGKFDGVSVRVPVVAGSLVDITFIANRNTTVEEVNEILKSASKESRWENIFSVTEEDLVSSDILGTHFASIADLKFTKVVDRNLVKVLAWYDNEAGYTHTLVEHAIKIAKYID